MTELTVKLDEAAIREATSQALAGLLSPEMKERLIQIGIGNVLSAKTGPYSKLSFLESAFQEAIRNIAKEEAMLMVQKDQEIKSKIGYLLRSTADKILDADLDKMATRMANAFVDSIKQD